MRGIDKHFLGAGKGQSGRSPMPEIGQPTGPDALLLARSPARAAAL
jgi:hypothetical protein